MVEMTEQVEMIAQNKFRMTWGELLFYYSPNSRLNILKGFK